MRAQVAEVTYLETLEAAWQDHLAPRAPDAPTVVSTFAGCGGSSLGYSMAGFHELLAVEWDDNAVETFHLNFPEVPVYHGDIAALSVEEALGFIRLDVGALDVLDGSPPCQGFSTAGKRILDDPRNQLFREFVRLLAGLRPRAFVMENVSGMVKGKMRLVFAEILHELKGCGYRVSARLLNAMYFGVPQSRARMIFIGVRDDLGVEPTHPKAAMRPIPVGNVITGCAATRSQRINPWVDGARPAATLCKTHTGYEAMVAGSETVELPEKYHATWAATRPGENFWDGRERLGLKPHSFDAQKLDPTKPCSTIKKQIRVGQSGLYHWAEPRSLTIAEAKLVGSFPAEFQFIGKFANQWARIGNSVPPLFMRAIAQHVRSEILEVVS